jgi:tRNA(adenine34) deaminase
VYKQSDLRKIVFTDEYFMRIAFQEAKRAYWLGEIPVGAIVVSQNRVIAKAYNQVEALQDPTAHAEMLALSAAFNTLGGKYLTDCTLYVTLEPCLMCANATYWSQLGRLVYGASDAKRGYSLCGNRSLHPRTQVRAAVLAPESQAIIQKFFIGLRN